MYAPQISNSPAKAPQADLLTISQKPDGGAKPTSSFDNLLQQSFKSPDRQASSADARRPETRPTEPRRAESQRQAREANTSATQTSPARPDSAEANAPADATNAESPTSKPPASPGAPDDQGKESAAAEAATTQAAPATAPDPASLATLSSIIAALAGKVSADGKIPSDGGALEMNDIPAGDASLADPKLKLDPLAAKTVGAELDSGSPDGTDAPLPPSLTASDASTGKKTIPSTPNDALTVEGKPLLSDVKLTTGNPHPTVGETKPATGELSAALVDAEPATGNAPIAAGDPKTLTGPAANGSSNIAATAQANGSATAPVVSTAQGELTAGAMNVAGAGGAHRAEQSNIHQLPVYTPAGHKAWAEDVGNRLIWMANRSESRAELMLTPPSLGKLGVSIQVNGDQTTAQFVAATPAAREALEQAMPRLRELLQQAGINLGQTDVSTSGEQQAREGGNREGRGSSARGGDPHGLADVEAERSIPTHWRVGSGNGAIDIFA